MSLYGILVCLFLIFISVHIHVHVCVCVQEQAAAKAPVAEAIKYALMKGWSLSQVKCPEFQNLPLKKKLVCMMRPRGKKDKERKKSKKEDKKAGGGGERERKTVVEMEDGTIYYEPESVYDLSKVGMSHACISVSLACVMLHSGHPF